MEAGAAESAIRGILDRVAAEPWFELHVPHGFNVARIASELRVNAFASGVLDHWRVTATLLVPIIYSADSSMGVARAALPATTDNVANLRGLTSEAAAGFEHARVTLRRWEVTPTAVEPPYNVDGTPNGEPASWTVAASFDVA